MGGKRRRSSVWIQEQDVKEALDENSCSEISEDKENINPGQQIVGKATASCQDREAQLTVSAPSEHESELSGDADSSTTSHGEPCEIDTSNSQCQHCSIVPFDDKMDQERAAEKRPLHVRNPGISCP